MSIRADCNCGKAFAAPDHLAGKRVRCPGCGDAITIPQPQAPVNSSLGALLDDTIGVEPTAPSPALEPRAMPLSLPSSKKRRRNSNPLRGLGEVISISPMAVLVALALAFNVWSTYGWQVWYLVAFNAAIGVTIVYLILVSNKDNDEEYAPLSLTVMIGWFAGTMVFILMMGPWLKRLQGDGAVMLGAVLGFCLALLVCGGLFFGLIFVIAKWVGNARSMGIAYLLSASYSAVMFFAFLKQSNVPGFDHFPESLSTNDVLLSPDTIAAQMVGSNQVQPHGTFQQVKLEVPVDSPGSDGPNVYLCKPNGSFTPRSLPCVIMAAPGGTCVTGVKLGPQMQPVMEEFVKHGYVVVAHEQGGELKSEKTSEFTRAVKRFALTRAGLVNAQNAINYVLKVMPEVDPERIVSYGHSSAGTESLLLASHDPRIKACLVTAPPSDLTPRLNELGDLMEPHAPGAKAWIETASPKRYETAISCPVLICHAADDENVPFGESNALVERLKSQGKDITLIRAEHGGHNLPLGGKHFNDSMKWLDERMKPPAEILARLNPPKPEIATPVPSAPRISDDVIRASEGSAFSAGNSPDRSRFNDWHRDDLKKKMEWAFGTGEQLEGRDYLYADLVTRDDHQLEEKLRVCPILKRPMLSLHWTVGVETSPLDFEKAERHRRVGEALASGAFRSSFSAWDQRDTFKDFAERAGTAGVAIAQAVSQRAADGRYGEWGKSERFHRDGLRGVTVLPASTTDGLLASARKAHADLLVAANIQIRLSAGKSQDATMVIRILDVETEKEFWRSEKLTTGKVASAKRRGDVDPAVPIAENAIKFIDENVSLKPVPPLKPDVAKKRAAKLVEGDVTFKLGALAELKYYERKEWISDDEARKLYVQLLGDEQALLMQSDVVEDRHAAMQSLVIEQ